MAAFYSLADIVAIARDHRIVEVDPAVIDVIARAHREARSLSGRIPTYGQTTGVGANKSAHVDDRDTEHGMRLLRSSAAEAGDPLSEPVVRSMLAVRLAQLSHPGSGIAAEIVQGLARALNDNSLPRLREFGSIGTADLTALASAALTMMGERPASRPGPAMPPWGRENALPFISSSALTIGRSALVADELAQLLRASEIAYALTFTATGGNGSAYSPAAAAASGAPGAEALAARLRALAGDTAPGARIQDGFGLRAFLSVEATARAAAARLGEQVELLANRAQENPLFLFDEDGNGLDVVHHGGFHQAELAMRLDMVAVGLAQLVPLNMSRIRMLGDPALTGLGRYLAVGRTTASGTLILEYVAASAGAEVLAAGAPASTQSVVLAGGTEEDASFASLGVAKLERGVRAFRVMVASELVCAVRALRQQGKPALGSAALAHAFEVLSVLPDEPADRDLQQDLELAIELIAAL